MIAHTAPKGETAYDLPAAVEVVAALDPAAANEDTAALDSVSRLPVSHIEITCCAASARRLIRSSVESSALTVGEGAGSCWFPVRSGGRVADCERVQRGHPPDYPACSAATGRNLAPSPPSLAHIPRMSCSPVAVTSMTAGANAPTSQESTKPAAVPTTVVHARRPDGEAPPMRPAAARKDPAPQDRTGRRAAPLLPQAHKRAGLVILHKEVDTPVYLRAFVGN